jgi:hypothetical protein
MAWAQIVTGSLAQMLHDWLTWGQRCGRYRVPNVVSRCRRDGSGRTEVRGSLLVARRGVLAGALFAIAVLGLCLPAHAVADPADPAADPAVSSAPSATPSPDDTSGGPSSAAPTSEAPPVDSSGAPSESVSPVAIMPITLEIDGIVLRIGGPAQLTGTLGPQPSRASSAATASGTAHASPSSGGTNAGSPNTGRGIDGVTVARSGAALNPVVAPGESQVTSVAHLSGQSGARRGSEVVLAESASQQSGATSIAAYNDPPPEGSVALPAAIIGVCALGVVGIVLLGGRRRRHSA